MTFCLLWSRSLLFRRRDTKWESRETEENSERGGIWSHDLRNISSLLLQINYKVTVVVRVFLHAWVSYFILWIGLTIDVLKYGTVLYPMFNYLSHKGLTLQISALSAFLRHDYLTLIAWYHDFRVSRRVVDLNNHGNFLASWIPCQTWRRCMDLFLHAAK